MHRLLSIAIDMFHNFPVIQQEGIFLTPLMLHRLESLDNCLRTSYCIQLTYDTAQFKLCTHVQAHTCFYASFRLCN